MQTNYSLIHYNIYNISPMQILFIHNTRKPVILCKPMKTILSIRFYPGKDKIVEITKISTPKFYNVNNAAAPHMARFRSHSNTRPLFRSTENSVPRNDVCYHNNPLFGRENNNFFYHKESLQERHINNDRFPAFTRFLNSMTTAKLNISEPLLITDGSENPTYSDLKAVQDRKTQEANNYRKVAEERANQPASNSNNDAVMSGNTPALLLITDGKENADYNAWKMAQDVEKQTIDDAEKKKEKQDAEAAEKIAQEMARKAAQERENRVDAYRKAVQERANKCANIPSDGSVMVVKANGEIDIILAPSSLPFEQLMKTNNNKVPEPIIDKNVLNDTSVEIVKPKLIITSQDVLIIENFFDLLATFSFHSVDTNYSDNKELLREHGAYMVYKLEANGIKIQQNMPHNEINYKTLVLLMQMKALDNIPEWTYAKANFLKDLKTFCDKYYTMSSDFMISETREQINFFNLYNKGKVLEDWEENIKTLLSKEKHKLPRVPPHCEDNILIEKEYIRVLKQYGLALYHKDPTVWHELIRRAGITTNVDASATREEVIDDKSKYGAITHWMKEPEIEGQGPKVVAEAYEIINKKPETYYKFVPGFSEKDIEEVLIKVMNESVVVGTLFRRDEEIGELPYLSGDDLHPLTTVEFPDCFLAVTTITSTNDGKTVKFGDKQYANQNIHESDKAEFFRPLTYLIHIPKNEDIFFKKTAHTDLIENNTYGRYTNKEIFIQALREIYPLWKKNMVREPISFTAEVITNLTIEMCESRLPALEQTKTNLIQKLKWDTLSAERKELYIEDRNAQQVNEIAQKKHSQYVKTLPDEAQTLFKKKPIFEQELKKHDLSVAQSEKTKRLLMEAEERKKRVEAMKYKENNK